MTLVSEIRSRLVRAFPENQADLLAEVLVESHAELVNRADFHKLTEVVHDLGEAQKRTEMRVEELADAQKRTEIHVDELARSQQEMRVTMQEMQATMRDMQASQQDMQASQQEMQGSLQAMQASQQDMQASQQEMQRAVTDLAKQVGGLSNAVGANLEDFACDLVPELLEKYWRFVTVSAGPEELTTTDGVSREFDVVVRGTIDGRPVTVLCETKATVSTTEVSKFLRIVEKVREAYPGEDIRPLFFGYKANSAARGLITQSHAAMIFTRGVMIPVAA
jgi:myosin heavy subunit